MRSADGVEVVPGGARSGDGDLQAGRGLHHGTGVLDGSGKVVFADDDLANLLGRGASQLVGEDLVMFIDVKHRSAARQTLKRAARGGRLGGPSWPAVSGDGQRFELALNPQPLAGQGQQQLFVVTVHLPTKRLRGTRRQALLAQVASECDEAIFTTSLDGLLETWNKAAEELFGWSEEEVGGEHWSVLVPAERKSEASELFSRSLSGETVKRVETVRLCKHGSRVEVSTSLAPLRDRAGRVVGVSQVVRDITRQKASERALAYQAMHDHLTGLPNRVLLEDRMAHALQRCRREGTGIGLVFFDVDHFKDVNDTAGHAVGDQLLREVASRLSHSVRGMDTVARLGGDEFVVLCEDISDDAQLDTIVSHVMDAFSGPVAVPGRQFWVSLSAGVVSGGPTSSVAQLLSQADAAMYQAKARARGSVGRYDPTTAMDLKRKAEGARLLRAALESRRLVPYYQPIVDLHTGTLVGAEALVRWEDPERGTVAAKDFIPLAEELGLVGDISDMVLLQAARQAKEWRAYVPGLKVTVNISPLQLRGTALLNRARSLLAEGVSPGTLVLEVTESALMEDAAGGGSVLSELREAGFGIAIDDFGTGYSSLAYLKQLPATVIKVDQTFTSQLPDPHDLSVVMAILAIADSYGLEVVAEGIESAHQAELLRELGCQHGQGYLFARPLPAASFGALLEEGPVLFDLSGDGPVPATRTEAGEHGAGGKGATGKGASGKGASGKRASRPASAPLEEPELAF